jgi:4-coumarate--CoA ligase
VIILLHSQNLHKYDLSSLRALMSGAAPLGSETQAAFSRKMPHVTL